MGFSPTFFGFDEGNDLFFCFCFLVFVFGFWFWFCFLVLMKSLFFNRVRGLLHQGEKYILNYIDDLF